MTTSRMARYRFGEKQTADVSKHAQDPQSTIMSLLPEGLDVTILPQQSFRQALPNNDDTLQALRRNASGTSMELL